MVNDRASSSGVKEAESTGCFVANIQECNLNVSAK
jgi:hypothetical protein